MSKMAAIPLMLVDLYVRVSTENQLENYSIEEQIERLKAYCHAKGWSIHKIYTDGGYSGGNLNRPALQQMLKDVEQRKVKMVVVYKLDRLSRSQKDTLTLIEDKFLANGVDFVSMMENFDTSTPFGRAMIGILSVFAQLEKDQITERFTMGRIGRCKAGYYHGGSTAPTGYDYIDGKLIVNPLKAKQVQEVYQLFLEGQSINAIQRHMHDTYGGWNSHRLITNVLRNSTYIGKVKFKGQTYDGVHQPIISNELFEQVENILNSSERENKKNTAQKTPFRAGYLLSSLVFCKHCGARYNVVHGCYRCYSRSKTSKKHIIDPNCKNKNWPIEELDQIIINELHRLAYNKGYANQMFEQCADINGTVDNEAILLQIKKVDEQISRMIDLYQVGTLPMNQISDRIKKLQAEKEALDNSINRDTPSLEKQREQFFHTLSQFDEIFGKDSQSTLEQRRLFVSSIIESIWIDEEDIEIKCRI